MKQLAIMSQPDFGMRDIGNPAFWFSVSYGEEMNYGALIVLSVADMVEAVREADIYDLKALRNHPCQIEVDGNNVTFVKILKR